MAPNRNPYVYPTVDWMKEMFKDYTVNQRVNFNVRGGGSVATYYLAGTFSNEMCIRDRLMLFLLRYYL